MTAVTKAMGSRLCRAIVLRQVTAELWRVEGYERQGANWRFTWLLHPAGREDRAQRYAADLARETGLPVARQPLGEHMRLVAGVLGRVAA